MAMKIVHRPPNLVVKKTVEAEVISPKPMTEKQKLQQKLDVLDIAYAKSATIDKLTELLEAATAK